MHMSPRGLNALPAALPALVAEGQTRALVMAEMLALVTLRLWAAPHRQPRQVHADWREALERAGMDEDDGEAFDVFMRLVVTAAHRTLDVRCVVCPALSPDEVGFLGMLRALQAGQTVVVDAMLGDWLPVAAARTARPFLMQFAAGMAARGLALPARQVAMGVVARAGAHGACLH